MDIETYALLNSKIQNIVGNENNKVFCAQFVADELIAENIEKGTYSVRVIDTQHQIIYPEEVFRIAKNMEYQGHSFMDVNDYEVCVKFTYNPNLKTVTLTMYGIGAIASSDYHIDIFKLD